MVRVPFGGTFCVLAVLSLNLVSVVSGCGDDHDHAHLHSQSKRSSPGLGTWSITTPTRPLTWGDLNIIHTTDSHGWLLGHQKLSLPEPNYSGTLGDFASFVAHMKQIALEKDVDLLLVDSGDLHDGTGLSDGFPPGGVDAHDSNQFIKQLPYDILAIGNHELYIYNNTLDMHTDFAPFWKGRYLSSNVNITIPSPTNPAENVSVPVGSRYAKFRTRLGRRVTSLGVLFDFTGNDEGTTVQKVEDMVKEQWFAEAIAEEPDLFLLVGHMPVQQDNWPIVFNAVRAVHPTTPILIFGGHTHIRDCVQFDGRSMALESGRYMETVGWMSVNLDTENSSGSGSGNLTFSRRYLDANKLTYEFHTGRNNHTFDTLSGQSITAGLEDLAKRFDLNFTYGVAPHDFTISRDPYPSNGSSLTLFIEQVVPIALSLSNTRNTSSGSVPPALYIANSGSQRFDIFKGPFTKNDQLTASPFTNAFLFLPNVSYGIARRAVGELNDEGEEAKKRDLVFGGGDGVEKRERRERREERRKRWMEELYKRGEVEMKYRAWLQEMYARELLRAREYQYDLEKRYDNSTASTLGYVTSDSCPGIGDDTPHSALPFFSTPTYISSTDSSPSTPPPGVPSGDSADSTPVDLVFLDFFEADLLEILNELQSDKTYSEGDVGKYTELLANDVLSVFAQAAWS